MGFLFDMILNNYVLSDKSREIGEMKDEFQLKYLASTIVDGTFNFFKIERKNSMLENHLLPQRHDKTNILWIYK